MTTKPAAKPASEAAAPPKRRKNASKKNKKSWRKNTDIDDVDEFLEDQVNHFTKNPQGIQGFKCV